jgi:leucyl-tRNA synthetase
MQRNWIGRSTGAEIDFQVEGTDKKLKVFTTRPDTLYGATFMVVAPEHPIVKEISTPEHKEHVGDYIKTAQAKSDIERQETEREKTGAFTGAYAINPVNGAKIPIWVADYVLYGYGTGAIMAVPAHDDRDFEFAKKFDLPIVRVVKNDATDEECSHDEGVMMNSGSYDGKPSGEVREAIVADLEKKGVGKERVNYKIRDWLISRQRYWGAPIPMIHCENDGIVPVPEDQLPVVLPDVESFEPSGDGRSPLARVPEFVNVTCPRCGGPAQRETDTMDGFACSSWYFLRFADPHNNEKAFDADKVKYWLPVDDYIGGAEHAVMHLLYARMWAKVMHDAGLIEFDEPFKTLRNQGMILAPDGQKMSKSKGNTIEPDSLINQGYGADAIRIMELFIGPWNQSANWSTEGMGGSFRFLQRIWALVQEYTDQVGNKEATNPQLRQIAHRTIKKVSQDLESLSFNTAIAAMMEAVNDLYKVKNQDNFASGTEWRFTLESLLQLLAPFAPHITEELWQQLGHDQSIHQSVWPKFDEKYLVSDTMTIAVQVNGKLRAELSLSTHTDEAAIMNAARSNEKVAAHTDGKEIVKSVYVPGKILNLVVK